MQSEYQWEFKTIKDNPYLTLVGELSGVFCVDFGEN